MAVLSCDMKSRPAIVVGLVLVHSQLDEILDNPQVTVLSCDVKGTCAIVIGLVLARSLLDEILDHC